MYYTVVDESIIEEEKNMEFDFFTLGGKQHWEDVFIYQGWRIQRHYKDKDCRLLDPFDIRRGEGTFDKCHKSFMELSKAYEIEKQKDHLVIMLHGLNEDRKVFDKMQNAMSGKKYGTVAINFPSTKKSIDSLARQINVLLENMSDVTSVSFITKGVSGLIIRKLLYIKNNWSKRIKTGKIIQICPPNHGNRFLVMLSKYKIFRWMLGPIISELTPKKTTSLPVFPKGVELGIIQTDFRFKKWARYAPKNVKENLPTQMEGEINCPSKSLYIPNEQKNMLENERIINACMRFLDKGQF